MISTKRVGNLCGPIDLICLYFLRKTLSKLRIVSWGAFSPKHYLTMKSLQYRKVLYGFFLEYIVTKIIWTNPSIEAKGIISPAEQFRMSST